MRQLDPDFVPHKVPFVIPGNTFLCSLFGVELHKAIPKFELNCDNIANLSKAAPQVFRANMIRKAANINLVRLDWSVTRFRLCTVSFFIGLASS